jgi:hypothetical protein
LHRSPPLARRFRSVHPLYNSLNIKEQYYL